MEVICIHDRYGVLYGCGFFFKQETAYERRISDWSSDVCSSDLQGRVAHRADRAYLRSGLRPRFEHDRGVRHPHPQETGRRYHHHHPRSRLPARRSAGLSAPAVSDAADQDRTATLLSTRMTGSLVRRMIAIAAIWISLLLVGGGFALDRVLTGAITRNFDAGLEYVLIAMIRSSEIGPEGEVSLLPPPVDPRFRA